MIETFIALLSAHILADFLFQSKWMAENKRELPALLSHISVVFLLALLALGGTFWPALFIALVHLQIDFAKARLGDDRLSHFALDQGVHLLTIFIALHLWPGAFLDGYWAQLTGTERDFLVKLMTVAGGLTLATRAGQFTVGKLMAPFYAELEDSDGLKNGGALIGLLERGLTFFLILAGQPAGVGLLMAAKSFLRVGTANESRKMAEYVIIGTLASIGWALIVAYGTMELLEIAFP